MSVPEVPESEMPRHEPPALNVPGAVLALLLLMVGVFVLYDQSSPDGQDQMIMWLALFPARILAPAQQGLIWPGGLAGDFWTFITYTFMHGSWTHLIVNSVWLLAFGSALARRLGAVRFYLFYFTCGIAGAALHVALNAGSMVPIVGASAALSGLMGGAARFIFLSDGPLGGLVRIGRDGLPVMSRGRMSIVGALTDRRSMIFILVWLGLNFLFGPTGLSAAVGSSAAVAWEAHMGGFLAGLLLFGLFDPMQFSASGGPGNVDYGQWLGPRDGR